MTHTREQGEAGAGQGTDRASAKRPFVKHTGLSHVFAATRYSLQGMGRLWAEQAFRHEVMALGVGLAVFALVGAPAVHFMVFSVLMLVLFAVEALNTAIEELVDRVSPELSSVGKHAKDLGSFSVFCLLIANGLFLGYSVISNLFF